MKPYIPGKGGIAYTSGPPPRKTGNMPYPSAGPPINPPPNYGILSNNKFSKALNTTKPVNSAPKQITQPVSGKAFGQMHQPGSGMPTGSKEGERKKEEQNFEEGKDTADDGPMGSKIVIHVCDENRKLNRDFKCDKNILLSQMKYFEKFQPAGVPGQNSTALEDLDISVHCDIQIFEWLMKYLHHPQVQTRSLETGNVISILISADYLQMPKLVEECIEFIRDHLQDVMKLPIDTNCITTPILKKLANITQIEELDEIKDRKDKLLSKLYMKKLELLLEDENHTLLRCVYCHKLFTRAQKSWMVCSKANIFIDFHGTVIAEHVSDRSWDINKFIHYLRQQGALSWKEIYYKIWAHLITLHCGECDQHFVGAEIGHCVYHSQKAKFGSGSNNGTYPCCGAPAIRFDTALRSDGCTAKNHRLAASWETPENKRLWDELMKRYHIISEPYISEHKYAEQYKALELQLTQTGRLSQQNAKAMADSIPLSKIKDSPPLPIMIQRYVASVGESYYSVSEDEDEDEMDRQSSTISETHKTEASSMNASTDKKPESAMKKDPNEKKKDKISRIKTNEIIAPPPQKMKAWKLDALRNDDRVQMVNMVKKLKRFRGDAPIAPRRNLPNNSTTGTSNGTASTGMTGEASGRAVAKRQSIFLVK